jgi:rare lipoprotein A
MKHLAGATPMGLAAAFAVALSSVPPSPGAEIRHAQERVTGPATPDLSARKRVGKASYYAHQFFGKPMADGARMNPRGNNAASRSLPLGTVAKVTDVATGKSAIVKIEDRGPYIKGRILDLSPSTARQIGITPRVGVANVVIEPIVVPLPGGRVKLGPAAQPHELARVAADATHKAKAHSVPRAAAQSAHGSALQAAKLNRSN